MKIKEFNIIKEKIENKVKKIFPEIERLIISSKIKN
jgi:hypothetical protein